MKIIRIIKTKAAIAATVLGTVAGAFLLPADQVLASDGNGAVYVEVPEGWQNEARTLQIKVDDYSIYSSDNKEIPVTYKKVDVAFDDGDYIEVTESMVVTITANCTLKLRALYEDGNFAYNEIKITNFDLEQPTIKATVEGEVLYLEATDQISGVKDISVNGKAFTELTEGKMCVNIKDLESTDQYISIHSDDNAGNASKEYKIKNPYFVGEIESGQEDKSLDNPDSVEATDPTEARVTVTDDYVTQGREFFTVDASGKTFYLIVDRTQNQENVYLLTEAGVNDLLNFTDYNGVDVQNGDIPMYEIPSSGGIKVEKSAELIDQEATEEEEETLTEEKPKGNSATMFIIVVIIAGVGVGYYFLKNKKRRDDLAEAEEMDAFDTPDDEIEDGDVEYEEDEEEETSISDEELEDIEIEYLDDDSVDTENVVEDYDEEDSDPDAERERLLAYFGDKETEE